MVVTLGQQYNVGENPPLCCTLTLIAIQGHQTKTVIKPLQCFCVFSFHLFWTSSSLGVPTRVTQEEGYTGFLIYLPSAAHAFIFLARRIQPILSLVDCEVTFFVLTVSSFSTCCAFSSAFLLSHMPLFIFFARRVQSIISLVGRELEFSTCWSFLVRKNSSYRDSNSCPSVPEGYEVSI